MHALMKVALAVVSFLLAAASWAGLFILFFAAFGKENYVATTATYGVLPILFLTKVLYDSVSPPESVQRAGTLAKGAVSLFLASTIWAVVLLFVFTWPSSDSMYDGDFLLPFAIIILLPAFFLAKLIYDALRRGVLGAVDGERRQGKAS